MALGEYPLIFGAFRFWVEIDDLYAAGFSEVTGLQSEIELEEYKEGGVQTVHRLPKSIKYPIISLKRGITSSGELWKWYFDAANGKMVRKTGAIVLQNQLGDEICRWEFVDAYPIKWTGPDLNSLKSEVAIESLEIVHRGLTTIFKNPAFVK